jgi:outer membrane protein assembly factor BamD
MRRKTLIFAVILLVLSAKSAYPYWIWTPKTGKWINPKNAPKPSPKEQYEYALTLFEAKDYEEAKRQFIILIRAYPKSLEASEGQYYLGRIQDEEGNLYEAYLAYQKVIDKYPFSERIQEIIERECRIGEAFLAGAKRKVFGVTLPVDNPAIEIFTKVIENSTYGPEAPKAQYKLGLVLKGLSRYYEAEEAFNKVISNYPGSEWIEAAKYQIAACRAAISRGPAYDQGAAREAQEKFEEFVREHPDAVLSEKAEKNIGELKEKEAEGNFNIARFYEKQRQYEAARVYYHEILNKCPDSPWAKKAEERLEVLKRMGREK